MSNVLLTKLLGILIGYVSEKGMDSISSKIREMREMNRINKKIDKQIEIALEGFNKPANAIEDDEYDFGTLTETLKVFSTELFIKTYAVVFSEKDKLKEAKEQIYSLCKCSNDEAKKKVKNIFDKCFSIVEEALKAGLSKEDWIQIGLINKHIDESTKTITDNSNQNTERIIEKFQDLKNELKDSASLASPTIQPVCTSPTNDNKTYRDAFTNPLFLEDKKVDKTMISLADMYISPSIQNEEATAAECIMEWYNDEYAESCFLLYGNAGVGKSSLVAKILADANGKTEKDKVEFDFDSSKVMAVALRNHTDEIDNELTAEEILTTMFNCDSAEQLKDKLLILDGLDELCVLKHDFNGELFLEKFSSLGYGYHVLVTSRESKSYFTEPRDEEGLRTEHLVWEERQINDWLELYKAKKSHKEEWCTKFQEQFSALKTDDKRRDIFCVPIILYICGTSETDIEDHSSIGSIYYDAFTKILLRKHLRGQSNTDKIKEADKESNIIAWQFTKELAYQMFLLDTLDLVDDASSDERLAVGFRNAQKRTKDILEEEYGIQKPNLELKKELAVCLFAREKEKGGIAFAHKTVYEYFTAVKLYEDYFAEFDEEYFDTKADDTAAMDVMESFIEAFRYDGIKDDIFAYLCKMNEEPFSTTLGYSECKGLDYKKYEQKFVYAMQKHMYALIGVKRAVKEYLYSLDFKHDIEETCDSWKSKSIEAQTSTAFANFTCFLTFNEFRNKEKIPECMLIGNFLHKSLKRANFIGWHLEGADLRVADLKGADLEGAKLTYANLIGTDLTDANLRDANLRGTNLSGADLRGAKLTYTNLIGADLTDADLSSAKLGGADLTYAHLRGADLRDAHLSSAHLSSAHLSSADLRGADLTYAHLRGTDLTYANLIGTDLTYANLRGTDLRCAELRDANLRCADLRDADLRGADLRGTDLIGTNLKGAKYSNAPSRKKFLPRGFDPKKHSMIEVDIIGIPVEDE